MSVLSSVLNFLLVSELLIAVPRMVKVVLLHVLLGLETLYFLAASVETLDLFLHVRRTIMMLAVVIYRRMQIY